MSRPGQAGYHPSRAWGRSHWAAQDLLVSRRRHVSPRSSTHIPVSAWHWEGGWPFGLNPLKSTGQLEASRRRRCWASSRWVPAWNTGNEKNLSICTPTGKPLYTHGKNFSQKDEKWNMKFAQLPFSFCSEIYTSINCEHLIHIYVSSHFI